VSGTNGTSSLVKATVYAATVDTTNIIPFGEDDRLYSMVGAIKPPYEPEQLCAMFDQSSSLRPNVDVLVTNVEGFGYHLEPTIDLDAPEADERIRDSVLIEALFDGDALPNLGNEAVLARRRELEVLARVEALKVNLFFDNCCEDSSFVELRSKTRTDLEVTGNGYWEVLRDRLGEIARFSYVPSIAMRLMPLGQEFVEAHEWQRISAVSHRRVESRRRFRRFVQYIRGMEVGYFKELGDPRVLSARTGRFYTSHAAMFLDEGERAFEATEIVHFKIHSPLSVYGVPRWVGASLAVLGTRDSEEVNLDYFSNKAVPPMAILVSGGTLATGATDRINDYVKKEIKGKANFHSMIVLEAEPAGGTVTGVAGGRVRIEMKSLMDAQLNDALFQTYEGNNAEKVGAQFRIPRILRGSMTDFNRSTAEAAIRYAEQQVFHPERTKIDYLLNTKVLADRGIRFTRFVSNSPVEKDPPVLVEMACSLVNAGVITPNEARAIVRDAFSMPSSTLNVIEAAWARIPVEAAKAGFAPEPTAEELAASKDQTKAPDIKLAPTDAARAITVNEARAGMKLGPLPGPNGQPDPKGSMSFSEFIAFNEGKAGVDAGPAGSGDLTQQARALVRLRDELREVDDRAGAAALAAARTDDKLALTVPKEEWDSWFEDQK
jgi:PBSX family phage portal protein